MCFRKNPLVETDQSISRMNQQWLLLRPIVSSLTHESYSCSLDFDTNEQTHKLLFFHKTLPTIEGISQELWAGHDAPNIEIQNLPKYKSKAVSNRRHWVKLTNTMPITNPEVIKDFLQHKSIRRKKDNIQQRHSSPQHSIITGWETSVSLFDYIWRRIIKNEEICVKCDYWKNRKRINQLAIAKRFLILLSPSLYATETMFTQFHINKLYVKGKYVLLKLLCLNNRILSHYFEHMAKNRFMQSFCSSFFLVSHSMEASSRMTSELTFWLNHFLLWAYNQTKDHEYSFVDQNSHNDQ